MVVGLASPSNFSSLPSTRCCPHPRPTIPTPCYTSARFGSLHLTGASTSTPLGHKKYFLMQLRPMKASFIDLITRRISRMSCCRFWIVFSKGREAHILRTLCSSSCSHFQIIAPESRSSVPRHYELSPSSRPRRRDPSLSLYIPSVELRGDARCLPVIVPLDVIAPSR